MCCLFVLFFFVFFGGGGLWVEENLCRFICIVYVYLYTFDVQLSRGRFCFVVVSLFVCFWFCFFYFFYLWFEVKAACLICWLYLKCSSTIPFHNQVPKILLFGNASKKHGCYILNENFSDTFIALSNDHDWQLCVVTAAHMRVVTIIEWKFY